MAEFDYNSRMAITKMRTSDREKRLSKVTGHDRSLAEEIEKNEIFGEFHTKIIREFDSNPGKKPSQWFGQKGLLPGTRPHQALLNAFVPKPYQDSYLYIIDKLNQFPFSKGWNRRTVRTAGYGGQIAKVFQLLKAYEKFFYLDAEIHEVILGKLDAEKLDYVKNDWNFKADFDLIYAAEIDRGNQAVIAALKEVILSENNTAYLDRKMILGILRSDNQELIELVCGLLLAARLQEGLRQAICETMDSGTKEAFLKLFKVIEDNDLIRFSSVKRAVSTWIGIFDENNVDRVSGKLLTLMGQCLRNEAFCREQLKTNDAVAINAALWALGFVETEEAISAMEQIIDSGTKPQKLAVSYYNHSLFRESLKIQMAKKVVLEQTDDLELVAAFMPAYTSQLSNRIRQNLLLNKTRVDSVGIPKAPDLKAYFENREDAERQYEKLNAFYHMLPKKGLTYSPCIFPWYSVKLEPSDVIRQMAFTAYMLQDQEKITESSRLLGEVSGSCYDRKHLINLLLYEPKNREQKDLLIGYMGNAETDSSVMAIQMVKRLKLEPEDYVLFEDMLRFKRSGLRQELLALLMGQRDAAMEACLKRLLSDKKEEKRTAGLDMLLRLSRDEKRAVFFERVRPLAQLIEQPTDKEKLLQDELHPGTEESAAEQKGFGLYDPDAPEILMEVKRDPAMLKNCLPLTEAEVMEKIKKLDALVREHREYEYQSSSGDKVMLGNSYCMLKKGKSIVRTYTLEDYPLAEVFRRFYQEELGSYDAFMEFEAKLIMGHEEQYLNAKPFFKAIYGTMPFKPEPLSVEYKRQLQDIRLNMRYDYVDKKDLFRKSVQALQNMTDVITSANRTIYYRYEGWNGNFYNGATSVSNIIFIEQFFRGLDMWETDEEFSDAFFTAWRMELKCRGDWELAQFLPQVSGYHSHNSDSMTPLCPYWFLKAYHMEMISRDILYKAIFQYFSRKNSVQAICELVKGEYHKPTNQWLWNLFFGYRIGRKVAREGAELVGPDTWCGKLVQELYDSIVPVMVDVELRRGEAETVFSGDMSGITYIQGIPYLVRILMALGNDTLGREAYYSWYSSTSRVKKEVLSGLLKSCYPLEGEDGAALKKTLKGTKIKESRLVEVAMYAPQWIDIIQEYLGWDGLKSGCYYFMAHMNERFDDQKKAMIAKYTPLSPEELQDGAFDVDWFQEAYELLGEKNFSMLYQAAKYISDGQKHSRARKYADAATGKVELEVLRQEIQAKRNKDLLMSYGLVPFAENREKDMLERYQFIQQYGKESRQFGAQRRASEGKAAEIGLVNLSVRAGFADVTRLTLRMESKLAEEFAGFMQWTPVDDVEICLSVDQAGKSEIQCRKAGKALKSVPSRLNKHPYVLEMKEAHKKLKDQYTRTRKMMEEAMESGSAFTAAELLGLLGNPVVQAILKPLVFVCGEMKGFLACECVGAGSCEGAGGSGSAGNGAGMSDGAGSCEDGCATGSQGSRLQLVSAGGQCKLLAPDAELRIAHPLDLYRAGIWHDYQKYLFDHEIRQPFKQVFRELYVKLSEEMDQTSSRMFAGNQIQPQKTVGCLKGRRWVADYEEGLQKVYYKENIIARIYALADWFSPSDVEAPTLEWVEFSDRKTFKALTMEEVPDLIYSEVMRDVDLAVSVAHAGGVDPETSHSTIEMRRAIVEFNLPLFGLKNVELKDSHAVIKGSRATYNVHLGSGVVHQEGGAMLNILPVHSQKRGKLFLPFIDEDPKTAEIMSKIVLLSEDKKLKDPSILEQIR